MLSREVLKEEEREEEAEGMLRFDDNKLPSRALLVFSPDPELGLILRKLEVVDEGFAPPDSSSLLLAEPLRPDLRKELEPPPGRQDIVSEFFLLQPEIKRERGHHCSLELGTGEKVRFDKMCFLIIIIVARWKQLLQTENE